MASKANRDVIINELFNLVDKDKNGKITRDEADALLFVT